MQTNPATVKRRVEYLRTKLTNVAGATALKALHARLVEAGAIPRHHGDLDRFDEGQLDALATALEGELEYQWEEITLS
jgi:hypothetical protein